ncbi:hypothetical protein CV770_40970 [Bradyrhizobium sp. AC87j1]|nr:hypothetical protein CV770_40970 [Bradyrhizobium sp. AC87j1]
MLSPFVKRVVIANPLQMKAIAHAHVKTDKVDAGTLASLYAAGYLPEIWTPDAATERLRRLVARRYQVVRHRTRIKNEVHAILHAHLIPKCPRFIQRPRPRLAGAPASTHKHDGRRLGQAAADDHRRQSGGGGRVDGGNWRYHALQEPAETGQLLRAQSACAPVGPRCRSSWPDQQGRTQPRPGHAGRSRLGCRQGTRTAPRFLRAYPRQTGPSSGRRRRSAQADRPVLASADERRGLPLGPAQSCRSQDARHGVTGWPSAEKRQHARLCLRVQYQTTPRSGDARRRASAEKV